MDKSNKRWSIIEILSHSRHDWMNKLQLLKGNLALKKYDRAKDMIDEIVMEAQHESKLCNLKMNQFAEYILTYNWMNHSYTIEYFILGDVMDLSNFDKSMTNWVQTFFTLIEEAVEPEGDNHLMLTIETDQHQTRFLFDFHGILKESKELRAFLSTSHEPLLNLKEVSYNRSELLVKIVVKDEQLI